jgi:chemotaxis protein MotB
LKRLKTEIVATQTELDENKRKLAMKVIETGELEGDIETMQAAIRELQSRKDQAENTLTAYKDLLTRFQTMIDAGTLKVKVVDGRMVVALATDILFPAGSAGLSTDGQEAIEKVASVLASIPDRNYQVAGHTDDRPISNASFASNWHLGAGRAIAVTNLLVGGGLPTHRVSAASYGDTKPVDTNRSTEGRANNRRIEIIIVPDLAQLPGYSELRALADSDTPN